MVSVPDLHSARPRLWREAADDALRAAKYSEEIGVAARDDVARTLQQCWVGDTGEKARRVFVKHADDFEAAALSLRALTKVYDNLADAIEAAQRDLNSALDYARSHELHVDDSGRVASAKPVVTAPGGDDTLTQQLRHVQGIITDALGKATTADNAAAAALRAISNLTDIKNPELVKQALKDGSPLNIAMRLTAGPGGLHPVNVSAAQLAAVDRASRETGMSKTLLLAILWQEQQWYQNFDKDGRGFLPSAGRVFNWSLEETVKPDKSLGITHMKLKTARQVLANHDNMFTADGRYLSSLSDAELTKYIEENPNEDIRLSAYYLQDLKKDPYGSGTDKQLFILYAADTPQVREANEKYGDDSDERGGAIRHRAENWDTLMPHIEDAQRWEALSDGQRREALKQLESQTPQGHHVSLDPIYEVGGGPSSGTGSGAPEPGTPSPAPGPAPTPPR